MKKFLYFLIIFFLFLNNFSYSAEKRDVSMTKKTIMIDLDGVLDNYTKYSEEIPEIRKGAKGFVKKLSKDYELILFTTRNSMQATKWLEENKIDKYFKDVTNTKYPAYIYIDDRAIKFNGDYNKTLSDIEKFTVHRK